MQTDKRQLLIDLGPDALADALLDLASRHEAVENRVSRMTSSGAENLTRFRQGLKDIIRKDHFSTWHESNLLAETLIELLADLDAADVDPWHGVEAVIELYQSDEQILSKCDDSDGDVSMIFTLDAPEVFSRFLSQCDDDVRLIDALIDLTRQDPFDLRASLFDSAADHLSEAGLKALVNRLWTLARNQDTPFERSYWLSAIEAVARRTGNAPLFEEARRAAPGELSASDMLEIARIHHAAGDSSKGLEILNSRPTDAPDTRRDLAGRVGSISFNLANSCDGGVYPA